MFSNRFSALVLPFLLINSPVLAAPVDIYAMPSPVAELKDALTTKAKKIDRSIASEENITEAEAAQLLSSEMKELQNAIFAVKTPVELDALLIKTMKILELNEVAGHELPNDYMLFASQFVLLHDMRSIVWKLIPLVDGTVGPRRRGIQGFILTHIRNLAKNMNIYFPQKQWQAGFKYVTEPFSATEAQFKDEDHSDLINFFTTHLMKDVQATYNRIHRLTLKTATSNEKLIWSNRLAYGTMEGKSSKTFPNEHFAYRYIGNADISLIAAGYAATLSSLKQARAYNLKGSFEAITLIGKLAGVDGFLDSDVNGITDKSVRDKFLAARKKYPNFLKLRTEPSETGKTGKIFMAEALQHLQDAYVHVQNAWTRVKSGEADPMRLINPNVFRGYAGSIERSLKTTRKILGLTPPANAAAFEVVSLVDGKSVDVNLANMFRAPAEDLLELFPTAFDETENRCPSYTGETKCKSKQQVRNYHYGAATSWNFSKHAYFPNLKSTEDFNERRRIIAEASTFWPMALPLALMP